MRGGGHRRPEEGRGLAGADAGQDVDGGPLQDRVVAADQRHHQGHGRTAAFGGRATHARRSTSISQQKTRERLGL